MRSHGCPSFKSFIPICFQHTIFAFICDLVPVLSIGFFPTTISLRSTNWFGEEMDPVTSTLQQLLGLPDELEKHLNAPTRTYVRDTKAMASTPVDVKEYPNSYVFILDMPGVESNNIKVQVEDEKVMTISGERKREEEEDVKYIRMERRAGKFMRKFALPDDCNLEAISASCQDGVLSVTVPKLPPPQPKKPKTIEVQIG